MESKSVSRSKHDRCNRQIGLLGDGLIAKASGIVGGGNGLFTTTKTFKRGDAVAKFDGVVIDMKEAKVLRDKGQSSYIVTHSPPHTAVLAPSAVSDSKYGAQFANHMDKKDARLNVKLERVFDKLGNPWPFLVAIKDIPTDTELFFCYGGSAFVDHEI